MRLLRRRVAVTSTTAHLIACTSHGQGRTRTGPNSRNEPLLISLLNLAPPLNISSDAEKTPPVEIEPCGRFDGRHTLRTHAMGTSIANRAVRSGAA